MSEISISFPGISGKVVVVTGSNRGIGKGIAKRFAEFGCHVVVQYHTNQTEAGQVVTEITEAGGDAIPVQADVTVPSSIDSLIDITRTTFKKIDIWINNAGIYPTVGLLDMQAEQWDQMMESNLRSVFLCTQAAARYMIDHQIEGNIINIASIEGSFPANAHSHYNASKAGVLMFTKASCRELAPYGIRVNSISPGLIHAPGIEQNWPEGVSAWKEKTPLVRLGTPQDIANACLFLASSYASWITGINLVVDGGASTTTAF